MATSNNNVVTHGLSGKIGDLLLFRQWFGRTVVGKIPSGPSSLTPTMAAAREKFRNAANWAKAALANALVQALYKEKAGQGISAHNLALADYIRAPRVAEIKTDGYTGAVGSTIEVLAVDDFKVQSVLVTILAPNGNILEQGNAMQPQPDALWVYTATVANPSLPGSRIKVVAKDLPGNSSEDQKLLS
jgi:hypothetical protein